MRHHVHIVGVPPKLDAAAAISITSERPFDMNRPNCAAVWSRLKQRGVLRLLVVACLLVTGTLASRHLLGFTLFPSTSKLKREFYLKTVVDGEEFSMNGATRFNGILVRAQPKTFHFARWKGLDRSGMRTLEKSNWGGGERRLSIFASTANGSWIRYGNARSSYRSSECTQASQGTIPCVLADPDSCGSQ